MNDIYASPESELGIEQSLERNFKLYKLTGIGVATFFGSPLAGGYLVFRNFKSLGLDSAATKAL